jgi:alpha-ketoglutarate-dependent taurine dioxygenase
MKLLQHVETSIYRAGSDSVQPMAGQERFERQCENHGHPTIKLHPRGAAFCNKIFVVRKSKTKEDIQKNESAVWWKLYE